MRIPPPHQITHENNVETKLSEAASNHVSKDNTIKPKPFTHIWDWRRRLSRPLVLRCTLPRRFFVAKLYGNDVGKINNNLRKCQALNPSRVCRSHCAWWASISKRQSFKAGPSVAVHLKHAILWRRNYWWAARCFLRKCFHQTNVAFLNRILLLITGKRREIQST